ncbi:MAG: universal stress protein [Deltaproteobacteria bacterium]|nr:universal stress protein [Deltaproteobacteria bacterium]
MFSKILLPADFSDCSAEAAKVARLLAERFGSRITVLHILDEPAALDPMFRGDVPLELLRGRMESYAKESMDAFTAAHFSGFANFDTMLAVGIPYREIIRKARECGAGLIVIGTHGRTGVEHVIFGSTAEKVVRNSHCPVLTVRMGGKEFIQP